MDKRVQADRILGFQRLFIPGIYLLISILLALFSVSLVQLIGRLSAGWNGNYLPWGVLIVAIESFYSYRFLKKQRLNFTDWKWWLYTLSEWILVIIGLRVTMFLFNEPGQFWQNLNLDRSSLISALTGYDFIFSLVILLLALGMARYFARNMEEMFISKEEVTLEISGKMHIARQDVRRNLINQLMYMGGFMVFLVILSRLDMKTFLWSPHPYQADVSNLVLYFILLLVFFALTEFSVRRESWMINKIPFDIKISTRWFLYALLLFFLAGIIAMLLPTRYTLNLLEVFNVLLNGIGQVILFIVHFFLSLLQFFFMGIAWLLSLFGTQQVETTNESPSMPDFLPPPEPVPTSAYPMMDVIKSILFWGIFLAMIIFGFSYYLRQNKYLIKSFQQFKLAKWLNEAIKRLCHLLGKLGRGISEIVRQGFNNLEKSLFEKQNEVKRRNPRLYEKTDRIQVLLLYRIFLKFMEGHGKLRRSAETPKQFGETLSAAHGEIQGEITSITQLFHEARYSNHDIHQEKSNRMKQAFHRVREYLKKLNS